MRVTDGKVSDTQSLSIKVADAKGATKSGTGKADTLKGTAEADTLRGGGGNDKLTGGQGTDRLWGGSAKQGLGHDTFVFAKLSDSTVRAKGRDTIYDFGHDDRIDLHRIDASTKADGNQSFTFIGTADFHGNAGELRFEKGKSNTYISADTNGDKHADFAIHLDDALTMAKADFWL